MKLVWLMPNETARWGGAYQSLLWDLGSLGFEVSMAGYYNISYVGNRFNPNLVDKIAAYVLPSFNPKARLNRVARRLDFTEVCRIAKYLTLNRIDVVITTAYLPGLHDAARKAGTKTILWSVDDTSTHCPVWFEYASKFDKVFTYSKGSVEIYSRRGSTRAAWLPQAIDPRFYFPRELPLEYDLSFVGSNLADRIGGFNDVLLPLMKTYPNFHLFGAGWESTLPAVVHGPVDWRRIPSIYCSSKIAVNVHRDGHKSVEGTINTRVFEVLGCRSFLLCDDPRGIEELFEDKKDIVIARSSDEAVELAAHYLGSPDERMKIASSGYRKVVAQHTTMHRARAIAAAISRL